MKKIIILVIALLLLSGCKKNEPLVQKEELDIIVASDLHYFDPDLYKDCDHFEEILLYGDGRMIHQGDLIIDTFIDEVITQHPDLLVLTGDLTFNGEKTSHEKLSEKLMRLKDHDIPVAIIPGNHDIDNFFAKGYSNEGYTSCDSVTLEEFKKIYQPFIYENLDKTSASHVLSLNEKFDLILLDDGTSGKISDETKTWLANSLTTSSSQDKTPIVAMHHNLAIHNNLLNSGYTITDHESYVDLFNEHQVPFVLSGHIHCQHIQEIDGIYDIATATLLNAPFQYGKIHLTSSSMTYENKALDIDLDASFFNQTTRLTFGEQLTSIEDESIKDTILNTLVLANRYYFSGNIYDHQEEILNSPGYALIQEHKDELEFIDEYLQSMLEDDHSSNQLSLEL